jgi:hypothetical protein
MPNEATVNKFRPYTPQELDAITGQLTAEYARTEARLLRILAKDNITSWRRAFSIQQLQQVDNLLNGLTATGTQWTETHIPELYKRGQWTVDGYLQPGGLSKYAHPGEWTPMDLGMTRVHDVAMRNLAENAALKLGNANSFCAQRIKSMVARTQVLGQLPSDRDTRFQISEMQWGIRDASLDAMQQSFASGETMREAQQRFLAELNKRGITSFVDAAGKEWNMETYAQMVARTVASEAQRHGLQNRMMEIGEDLVEVVGKSLHVDSCAQYEGKILSITGKTDGYTSVDEARANSHLLGPNCIHSLVPYIADEDA